MDPIPPSSPTLSQTQSPSLQPASSTSQDQRESTSNTLATPSSSQNGSNTNNPVPQSSAFLLEEPTLREVMLSDVSFLICFHFHCHLLSLVTLSPYVTKLLMIHVKT